MGACRDSFSGGGRGGVVFISNSLWSKATALNSHVNHVDIQDVDGEMTHELVIQIDPCWRPCYATRL